MSLTAVTGKAAGADTKVACVGDSITAGSGASSTDTAYPAVLGSILGTGWDVRNFGNSGKTAIKKPADGASYWSTTQFTQSQSFQPNVVVIMLGTNDSKTDNWKSGNNTYAEDYAALVGVYTGLASKPKVYAVLPIPALSSQYNISASAIQNGVIPTIKQVAAQTGIELVDLNTAFAANQPAAMLGDDQIHPNDKGYRFIAQTVATVLEGGPGTTSGDGGSGGASSAGGASSVGGASSAGGAGRIPGSSAAAGYAGGGGVASPEGTAGAKPESAGAGGNLAPSGESSGGNYAGSVSSGASGESTLVSAGRVGNPQPTSNNDSAGCRIGAPLSGGWSAWAFAPLLALARLRRARRKLKRTAC